MVPASVSFPPELHSGARNRGRIEYLITRPIRLNIRSRPAARPRKNGPRRGHAPGVAVGLATRIQDGANGRVLGFKKLSQGDGAFRPRIGHAAHGRRQFAKRLGCRLQFFGKMIVLEPFQHSFFLHAVSPKR